MKAVIQRVEDCVNASEKAIQFCLDKGMSSAKAMYCGLCIEEMTVYSVVNRFRHPTDTLDVRLIYEAGTITILLRDDCGHFDPMQWLELCSPEDQERSVGIRMVSKLASNIKYASTLGLNVVTIEIDS